MSTCPQCEALIDVLDQCEDCLRYDSEAMKSRRGVRIRGYDDPTKCVWGHPRHRTVTRWRCRTCDRIQKAKQHGQVRSR